MKNIEKSLTNFVKGKGPKVSNDTLCLYAEKDANEMINILFSIINQELDAVTGVESLDRVRELLKCINIVLVNSQEVNRKIVSRKLHKLDEKIDRLKRENKNKFINIENAYSELEKTRQQMDSIAVATEEKETKQYDFISYLMDAIKNITYLEYTFHKMPGLVNVKDKEEISLFRNVVNRYIQSVKEEKEEDTLYYNNLLSLILSQKSFQLSESEKRKCLEMIHTTIDKLSCTKRELKKNKNKIDKLKAIEMMVKGEEEKGQKIDLIAIKYNISVYFDEDLLEKARLVKTPKVGEKTDREVVQEYILTIDKENAVEIDDALSCRKLPNGNYLLGIHIASVLGYFPYESEIIEEALHRNRSIYLPKKYQTKDNEFNRTIPIFPYAFSAATASLIEGSPKLARSYFFELDSEGNIVSESFKKTIIANNKKCTYEEIDNVLKHGSNNKELQTTIENLQEVTELLDKKYKGMELYEQVKENMEDYSDLRVKRIGAEKIVYQTMLLTGNRVANFFAKEGYPCLYRVHEVNESDSKKLQAMIANLTKTYGGDQYKKLYQLIQGIYPKGWYDIEGSHSGLGLDHYCHCTSGLRRAADIVVEHALEVCHDKNPTDQEVQQLADEIKKRSTEINAKQDPIEWFVKDFKRAYQKRK